jgi:Rrf2 family protein
MRLSRETRYAIEALVALSTHPPGEAVDARTIALEAGLPVAFLQKILRSLAVGGVVAARRGRGFTLARGPAAITMQEVLSAVEGKDVFGGRCIFWREECSTDAPCALHFRWRELRPAMEESIGRTTLAEVRDAGALPVGLR